MAWDRAVEQLRAVGMSGYEAKAYLALLSAGRPLNGYEVAKASFVPRSTVYETLAKLVSRGAAFETRVVGSDMTAYLALPADALLSRLRREFDENVNVLSRVLPEVIAPSEASLVQNLRGRPNVIARTRDVIASATEDLFVSMWAEDASEFTAELRAGARRGVDISYISFGDGAEPIGHFYHHQFSSDDVVLARVGARLFVVAGDRRSVVIGGAVGDETWALWSDDPAVVLVAVEYVRHDIAMQVLVDRLGADAVELFWHTDEHLERLQTGRGAPNLPSARRRSESASRRRRSSSSG